MKGILIVKLAVMIFGVSVFSLVNFAMGGEQNRHDSHHGCGKCHTDSSGTTITPENLQLNAHAWELQAAANSNKAPDKESENRIYEVFGMDCPGCHGGLNKLVKKIPAVLQSEANWKEMRLVVTVRSGARLNDSDIYDAIRRANFTPGKRLK